MTWLGSNAQAIASSLGVGHANQDKLGCLTTRVLGLSTSRVCMAMGNPLTPLPGNLDAWLPSWSACTQMHRAQGINKNWKSLCGHRALIPLQFDTWWDSSPLECCHGFLCTFRKDRSVSWGEVRWWSCLYVKEHQVLPRDRQGVESLWVKIKGQANTGGDICGCLLQATWLRKGSCWGFLWAAGSSLEITGPGPLRIQQPWYSLEVQRGSADTVQGVPADTGR